MTEYTQEGVRLIQGDCLNVMPTLEAGSVDAIVTDPPYGLKFMGKAWDHSVPGPEFWTAAKRVIKPGGFLLAFGGSRTFHRLACAIEDAGWEIRDTLSWMYGTGFPKSSSCLKPGWEPIILAKAPGKLAELAIDACRLSSDGNTTHAFRTAGSRSREQYRTGTTGPSIPSSLGRWPANVILSHDPECNGKCVDGCPVKMLGEMSGESRSTGGQASLGAFRNGDVFGKGKDIRESRDPGIGDSGTAARFFYCPKASRSERGEGNTHPTVKPQAVLDWLIRLISQPGDVILDPFTGSGSTVLAAMKCDRKAIGSEIGPENFDIAVDRIKSAQLPMFTKVVS